MVDYSELIIDESELQFRFYHSSGPGGQNVNKVATAVQLRFDVEHSPSLSDVMRIRLIKLAGSRMTKDGVLIISSSRYRTQEANKEETVKRLKMLLQEAARPPRKRKRTRPSRAAVERRLQHKRRHALKKSERRLKKFED